MRITFILIFLICRLTIYSQNQCTAIFSSVTSDVIKTNASGCNTSDGKIKIKSSKLKGLAPYSFSINNQSFSGDSLTNLAPGEYVIKVVDAAGCTDSLNVSVFETSGITFVSPTTSPAAINCNSSTGVIKVGNVLPNNVNYSFSINNGPKQTSNTFTGLPSGNYLVSIFYGSGGTCRYDIHDVYVSNIITSVGGCFAGEDATIFEGESVFLDGLGDGAISWNPSNYMTDPKHESTYATPPVGINNITLTAYNSTTCTSCSDDVVLTVIPELRIPNTFTPNGDNVNDVWEIANLDRFDNCEIWIYTRWGERIFHQKGYEDGEEWNGTNHGLPIPVGAYYYVIDIKKKDTEGKVKRYAGAINIVK